MSEVSIGILLSALAGILNGSFAAPTKYTTKWKWENIWAVWAVVGMLLFPWFLVFVTVPHVGSFYASASGRTMWLVILFGVGFGLAQIFFGLGIAAIGISLNFAIAIGLSTALGSLVPLVFLQPQTIPTPKGETIFLGVGLVLVGIVLCAVAGREKEKEFQVAPRAELKEGEKRITFKTGLIICILAGLGSPLINFGLAFGTPLTERALEAGVSAASQANVIWAPLVSASLVPYLIYCVHLWRKNRSFCNYALPRTGAYWVFGAIMGVLWFGSTAIYGASASHLQAMGPILGWPLFMSSIIITSNIWGFATGEWKGTTRKPRSIVLSGIFVLILGFVALAIASSLK
ncbi:MAG TPA: L-rhamnose/proton symporter RhaT [Terriglobia bacterium]|nr:L-rhamnose/proton symporter RhaT [Terriglobia bacterium]